MLLTLTLATAAGADDQSLRAAVGGGVGGAAGAYVGSELGGRTGAIVGGAAGAAAGTAIATEGGSAHDGPGFHGVRPPPPAPYYYPYGGHPSRFCPPGQAKKGRC
jgi:hypothetical protein